MLLDRDHAALVLVDYQSRLMPAIDGAEDAIRHGVFLAEVAHALGVPVVVVNRGATRGDDLATARVDAGCSETLTALANAVA